MAPWQARDAQRFSKHAKGPLAERWAKVANAVLKKNPKDEGRAVRIANSVIHHHAKRKGAKS